MVIRMRHTRAHTANRRSHHALKAPTLAICSNCEAKHRPHHMCQECGFYKGRLVIDMKAKNEARSARMQAKKDAIKESKNQEVSEEEQTNTIPNEGVDSPLEKVETAKSKEVDAPELAQAKTATPRKGQAS
jgi:large subunit ribosomal protein L32